MKRLLAAAGIALTASACSTFADTGPTRASIDQAMLQPECRAASPGNALPGFRCTGDYTGDAGTVTNR
ncbi:MAG: hypothetical protein AB7P02_08360 [Alphaproteobacteria bacterium]